MQAWTTFLNGLDREIGKKSTDQWLRSLKVIKFDACNLYLEASDAFQAIWFDEHIKPRLRTQFINNNGRLIKVHLSVSGVEEKKEEVKEAVKEKKIFFESDKLEPHCLFPQFVPGKNNEMSYKLMCELSGYQPDLNQYLDPTLALGELNPIYLYGGTGVGKTHMLMALAKAFEGQGKKAFYVRAETFTSHVISAFRNSIVDPFRKAYRNVDVLLVDDVHKLKNKQATQEELFHTFNNLHTRGKQIIIGSNCPPRLLSGIEERLISRFEWGINVSLDRLSPIELKEVVTRRTEMLQFPIPEEVTDFLIEKFGTHKSLTRAIEALVLRSHTGSKKVKSEHLTVGQSAKILGDLIRIEEQSATTPDTILDLVAKKFNISIDEILSKSQSKECVLPRQIAMYLCRNSLKMPYLKIGSLFARDHSTVMSSVKLIEKGLKEQNPALTSTVPSILRDGELPLAE